MEEYVKRGESTLITTTDRVFFVHHSATISHHFDKIFTPNALEMTLLSNDVKLHAYDWTFLKLSAVEREIDSIFCEIASLMTETIKFTPFYFHINLCMQCTAHSFADHLSKSHNLKASPFQAKLEKGTIIEKWQWLTADV